MKGGDTYETIQTIASASGDAETPEVQGEPVGDGPTTESRRTDVICERPYVKGPLELGCGSCKPCLVNRKRVWVARLQLELLTWPTHCFLTLTYDNEHLPADGSVHKEDLQKWLKRLRIKVHPRNLRYFAVGEYGDQTMRPHYHAIVFGVGPAEEELLKATWTAGAIHIGTAEEKSLSYVCGYVTKKMGKRTDPRLMGRNPEFCLMSRKPAIGLTAVSNLTQAYQTKPGQVALQKEGWISRTVRIGPKKYPLGRYLTGKLAASLGLTDTQKKVHQRKGMIEMHVRQTQTSITEYWKKRKQVVLAQRGRMSIETPKTL